MKITSIQFQNYKSFIQSQILKTDSNLVTIVGQNGSGKTNLLDALYIVFNPWLANKHSIKFHMNIQLTDADISRLKNHVEIDHENRNMIAYYHPTQSSSSITVNKVHAPLIVDSLISAKSDLISLGKQLASTIVSFKEDLKVFENIRFWPLTIRVKIDDQIDNIMQIQSLFDSINRKLDQHINQIDKLLEIGIDNDLVIPEYYFYSSGPAYQIEQFEFVYQPPQLAEFEKKYITIQEEELIKAIKEINNKCDSQRKIIAKLLDELSDKLGLVSSIIERKHFSQIENDDIFTSIYKDIIKVTNPKVYYIGSENNLVLFPDRKGNRRALITHSFAEQNIINSFLQRFYKFLGSDLKNDFDINKLTGADKEKLASIVEDYLNNNLLNFEKLNIRGVEVDSNLNFFIHEMTGHKIPLSETNAGRKWYISFLIIKSLMNDDDILLLDEPAANLHPSAQVEVLSEIEHLAENHKVILTTHSPYLVSSKSSVYQVSMTKEGSVIEQRCNLDLYNLLAKYNPDLSSSFGDLIIRNLLPLSDVARNVKAELKRLGKKQEEVMRVLCINDVNNYNRKMRGKNFTYNDLITIVDKFKIDPRKVLFR